LQLPIEIRRKDGRSLQSQIFDQLRGLILDGRLKPGTPVPATRSLAEQIEVSRNTVMLTYEQLVIEGYLQTRRAVGTFVSFDLPEDTLRVSSCAPEPREEPERRTHRQPVRFSGQRHPVVNRNRHRLAIDFWVGRPDDRSFPMKTWRRLLTLKLAQAGSNLTEYGDPAGLPELRQAIVDHLGPARGITATPEQVIVVNGSQEGLNIAARLFVGEGTPVVCECPCYQGLSNVMESFGAELIPVPVDQDGIDVSRLPKRPVSLAYVTPSHQYPMGGTLTLERRLRLLRWAWKTGAYIIEDDYDSDFRYCGSPLTALKGLDKNGCVIYLSTFSKSIGAGLRIGYLVLPSELVEPATTIKALYDNGHPWLDQAVLAEFIANGSFENHLRRIRSAYMLRRDCLVETLQSRFGDVELSGLDGGMHLVWHLSGDFPKARELQRMALRRSVGIYSLEDGAVHDFGQRGCATCDFWDEACAERTIMLGYASTPERQIGKGIGRIAAALADTRGGTSTHSRVGRRSPAHKAAAFGSRTEAANRGGSRENAA
jgi:GntR family transcriptional regulator/MocR family aminotransferase